MATLQPMTPNRETGWVIERYVFSELQYWTGDVFPNSSSGHGAQSFGSYELEAAFDKDHNKALRFARAADASLVLARFLRGNGRVAEHVWGLA